MIDQSYKSDLNADAINHLVGAISCACSAHIALITNDPRTALIEMDKVIAITHEARKFLLGKTKEQAAVESQPELLDEKEKNDARI